LAAFSWLPIHKLQPGRYKNIFISVRATPLEHYHQIRIQSIL
jgi:hypothetical protein